MTRVEHVQYGWAYRPQPLWLPVGLMTGAGTGAVVGAALLAAVSLDDPARPAQIGLWYGAFVGGVIGLAAGLVLTFAVGGHLDRPVARDRAFGLTTLVVAVPLVPASAPFILHLFPFLSLVLATLVSILAGLLARSAAAVL